MIEEENAREEYSGKVYFILPPTLERTGLILQDVKLLRKLDELNKRKRINNLFLKKDEKYSVLENYCIRKDIELDRINDNAELVEEITKFYGSDSRIFAYVTHSEDSESLRDSIANLADWGFYTEINTLDR